MTVGYRIQGIKGVTLFEFLIVVTVVSILVAILVLAYPSLVTSAKISRVMEEQRVISRALQNYRMDYDCYPTNNQGLKALSAPTAYLAVMPIDPFHSSSGESYYYFYRPRRDIEYLLISVGPDGDNDLLEIIKERPIPMVSSAQDNADETPQLDILDYYLTQKIYDPTNGTKSDGDMVIVSKP